MVSYQTLQQHFTCVNTPISIFNMGIDTTIYWCRPEDWETIKNDYPRTPLVHEIFNSRKNYDLIHQLASIIVKCSHCGCTCKSDNYNNSLGECIQLTEKVINKLYLYDEYIDVDACSEEVEGKRRTILDKVKEGMVVFAHSIWRRGGMHRG